MELLVEYVAKQPKKLKYSDLNEYFREMCYSLYLEELYENNPIEKFYIEWWDKKSKEPNKNGFGAVFNYKEEMEARLTPKMQAIRKSPFSMDQGFILNQGLDKIWYGYVDAVKVKSTKEYEGKIILLKIILYPWCTEPLPTNVTDFTDFNILPCSATATRIMFAMSNLNNPEFILMLLGHTPIRQVKFNNYVEYTKPTLNESQKKAIQATLNNSITVLQGPPGTGKTSVIVEMILQLLEKYHTFPILVVAASNIAIDNIAEKLLPTHARDLLRIVSIDKEKEYKQDHLLGGICLHHKVELILSEDMKQVKKSFIMNMPVSQNQFKKLMSSQSRASEKLIANAKVIFTTTVVAGSNQLKSVDKMPVIIMDESTQSSEPATLIPLSMPNVKKVVLVGDQKQLSSFSKVSNLELSLFERIIVNGTFKEPHMLDTQYRMHPAISEFPRKRFYNNLLVDGVSGQDRTHPLVSKPLLFWDTNKKDPESTVSNHFKKGIQRYQKSAGYSYQNLGEVVRVIKVLKTLVFEKGIDRENIGIITPYRAQRDVLSDWIAGDAQINPSQEQIQVEVDRDDIFTDNKTVKINKISGLLVASIDAFQGREKDFIIFSTVRSNNENNIGFVRDQRRLNVALTRARYGLILVGDYECLKNGDDSWGEYLTGLKEKDCVLREDEFIY